MKFIDSKGIKWKLIRGYSYNWWFRGGGFKEFSRKLIKCSKLGLISLIKCLIIKLIRLIKLKSKNWWLIK